MSFGIAIGDFIILSQLASKVVQGARQACGAHDELTREATSLNIVLRALEREIANPKSIIHSSNNGDRQQELASLVGHCEKVLKVLEDILDRYNGLSTEKKRTTKFWKSVKFGNGEILKLSELRLELATHTNVITMFLNLLSVGSLGAIEETMTSHGENLKALKRSANWITASMQANSGGTNIEGSVLTNYTNDDKTFWKEFRRELVKEGYSSTVLKKHKNLIRNYVKELGDQGALDELNSETTEVDSGVHVPTTAPGDVTSSMGPEKIIPTPNPTIIPRTAAEDDPNGNIPSATIDDTVNNALEEIGRSSTVEIPKIKSNTLRTETESRIKLSNISDRTKVSRAQSGHDSGTEHQLIADDDTHEYNIFPMHTKSPPTGYQLAEIGLFNTSPSCFHAELKHLHAEGGKPSISRYRVTIGRDKFVVPGPEDLLFTEPGWPSFAYNRSGSYVGVYGTPSSLHIQGDVYTPPKRWETRPSIRATASGLAFGTKKERRSYLKECVGEAQYLRRLQDTSPNRYVF